MWAHNLEKFARVSMRWPLKNLLMFPCGIPVARKIDPCDSPDSRMARRSCSTTSCFTGPRAQGPLCTGGYSGLPYPPSIYNSTTPIKASKPSVECKLASAAKFPSANRTADRQTLPPAELGGYNYGFLPTSIPANNYSCIHQ